MKIKYSKADVNKAFSDALSENKTNGLKPRLQGVADKMRQLIARGKPTEGVR